MTDPVGQKVIVKIVPRGGDMKTTDVAVGADGASLQTILTRAGINPASMQIHVGDRVVENFDTNVPPGATVKLTEKVQGS